MPKLDEVKKFKILTDISNHPQLYADKTLPDIKEYIIKTFDACVTTGNLARWSKIYGFKYKKQRQKKVNQSEELKRTNQRIRILSMVIRNLCKQLQIQHPSMLDKLIDGITQQYGSASCFEENTKELENSIHDAI